LVPIAERMSDGPFAERIATGAPNVKFRDRASP
ncbi:unnamed protein product, partial [marine sediment metagenome]